MQLIPSIDLRGGRTVRLLYGDFDQETRYEEAPLEVARRFHAFGARVLHVVDLDGARGHGEENRAIVYELAAKSGLELQVGGGIRTVQAVEDLLEHGVSRVVIGSLAVEQPALVREWLARWGVERVVLALDVRLDDAGTPLVQTRGWTAATATSLWSALEPYLELGPVQVLCTDIGRDGAMLGPNLDLYAAAMRRFPALRWQASGGVRSAADLAALAALGIAGAISGKALVEDRIPHQELLPFLPNA